MQCFSYETEALGKDQAPTRSTPHQLRAKAHLVGLQPALLERTRSAPQLCIDSSRHADQSHNAANEDNEDFYFC
jgi:hypothetical protein